MNKFWKLGLIEYNGHIKVHTALLNIIVHDQVNERSCASVRLVQRFW